MRTKLSKKELAGLEERIRGLLHDVEINCTSAGHRYFYVNRPGYCEAFGMIQALQVMGFGQMGGAAEAPKGSHLFDLRKWFDDIIEKIIKERLS